MANIDTAISLSGDREYKASIREMQNELLKLKSGMRATSEEFRNNADSVEALKAKQENLTKQIKQHEAIVAEAQKHYERLKTELGENETATVKMAVTLNNAREALYRVNNELNGVNEKLSESMEQESAFTAETENAKNELLSMEKTLDMYESQLAAIDKQYAKNGDSAQSTKEKQAVLTSAYGQSRAVVESLEQQMAVLKATVDENSDEFKDLQINLNNAKARMHEFENSIQASYEKLMLQGEKLKEIGSDLSKYVTAPLIGLGVAAGKAGIDFESAFAGVQKTVETTAEGYERLRQGILDMNIPVAPETIASVAEVAGQLGIAEDSILSFTRVMIDMGESTNLTAEQAASEMARFANIVKLPQSEVDRLGSSIVALGNTMATTESEISAMSLRLAAAADQANMAASDTLAFSATLSSLGIEAEAGGSAMSKFFRQIQVAVDTGNTDLIKFAQVSGQTAAEFKKNYEQDAARAVASFIQGLGKIKDAGGNLTLVLDDLNISEVRMVDSISRLAGSGDLLTNALETSKKAWAENSALAEEAAKRYETTASQIQGLWKDVKVLGIEFSEVIIPVVRDVIDSLRGLIQGFSNLDDGTKEAVFKMAMLAAATGPVVAGVGNVMMAIDNVQQVIAAMNTGVVASPPAIGGMATAMSNASGAATALGTSIKGTSLALGTVAPVLAVVTLAVGAGAAAWSIYKNSQEKARQEMLNTGEALRQLQDNLSSIDDQAAEVSVLVNKWRELNGVIQNGVSSLEERAKAETEIAEIERQLLSGSQGFITSYDAENGLIGEKIPLLEENLRIERELHELKLQTKINDTNIDMLRDETAALELKRETLSKTAADQLEAVQKLTVLEKEYTIASQASYSSEAERMEILVGIQHRANEAGESIGLHISHLDLLSGASESANAAMNKTVTELEQVTKEYMAGKISIAEYEQAIGGLIVSEESLNSSVANNIGIIEDAALAYEEAARAFDELKKKYKDGEISASEYTAELGRQMVEAAKLANTNTVLGKSYRDLSQELKKELLDNLRSSTSSLISETDKLTAAFTEQNEEKALSNKTVMDLIESGYSLVLQIDDQTGAVTLNKDMFIELEEAKIKNRLADIELAKSQVREQLYAESGAAETAARGYAELARVKFIEAQAGSKDLAELEMEAKLLNNLLSNVGKVTESYKQKSKASKGASSSSNDAYQKAVKNLEDRIELEKLTAKEIIAGYEGIKDKYAKTEEEKLAITKKITKIQEDETKKLGKAVEDAYGEHYRILRDKAHESLDMYKDVQRKQLEIVTEKSKEKVSVLDEEYIKQIGNIDAVTAAYLGSCNEQIQKEIQKIALFDEERAKRLLELQEEIDKIDEASEARRKANEEKRQQEKTDALQQKINTAESLEDRTKAEKELADYKAELRDKALDEEDKIRKKALQKEMESTTENAKKSIEAAKERIAKEQKDQNDGLEAFQEALFGKNGMKESMDKYFDGLEADIPKMAARLIAGGNTEAISALLQEYNPDWQNAGKGVMDFLTDMQKSSGDSLDAAVSFNPKTIAENYELVNEMMDGQKTTVTNTVTDMSDDVRDILETLAGDNYEIAKHAGEGFLLGLTHMQPKIVAKANEIAAAVISAMSVALEINSPSKKLRRIGQWTGAGYIQGIDDTLSDVSKAAQRLAGSVRMETSLARQMTPGENVNAYNSIKNNYNDSGGNLYFSIGSVAGTARDATALSEEIAFITKQARAGRGHRK